MSLKLQMFQGRNIVDVQNAVMEWINIEETTGLTIKHSETSMVLDPVDRKITIVISVWYETVIEEKPCTN